MQQLDLTHITDADRQDWDPCDLYAAYEAARDEVECSLAAWRGAPSTRRAEAFAVYRAAADREDAAAAAWLHACAAYDAAASAGAAQAEAA